MWSLNQRGRELLAQGRSAVERLLSDARRWIDAQDYQYDVAKRVIEIADVLMPSIFAHFDAGRSSRDLRQVVISRWAQVAFGREEALGVRQRGLRLLEEAVEAYQAAGGDEEMAHKLVKFVFERPPGEIGQELGGVAVTVLALAAAAGCSADQEECREIHRVLRKPLEEFTARNARKNAAGFKAP